MQRRPPILCLVTDRRMAPDGRFVRVIAEAVTGGVDMVQLREKDLPVRQQIALAEELRAAVAGMAVIVVNDRLDVALAAGLQGVHLGEQSLPVAAAVRTAGGRLLVGRSVHDAKSAKQAEADGASYLIAGHIFATASHPNEPPRGLQLIGDVRAAVGCALLAIGGITPANAAECIRAGADGVAVISPIMAAARPAEAARRIKEVIRAAEVRTP